MKSIVKCTLLLALTISVNAFTSSSAKAASCKDVKFFVTNHATVNGTPAAIKIVKIEYYDEEAGKWRDEAIKDVKIDNNEANYKFATEDLEYVKTSDVKVRYVFYVQTANGYKDKFTSGNSDTQKCDGGDSFTIEITKAL